MIAVGSITAYPAPKDGIDGISIKGDTGLTGLSIRNTEWIAGVYYRNDTSVTSTERFLDYAIIVGSGEFQDGVGTNYSIYQAKAAHNGVISSATNKPGSGANWATYWEKINVLKPVFTPILIASLIKASQIDVDSLIVKLLKTNSEGPRVEIAGSLIDVFGDFASPNIRFGVNSSGYAVLTYYDNNGNKLYDLGPQGIDWGSIVPASWSTTKLTPVSALQLGDVYPDWDDVATYHQGYVTVNNITTNTGLTYYKYYAGSNPTITQEQRDQEKYLHVTDSLTSDTIQDGWYSGSVNAPMQYIGNNTGQYIKPAADGIYPNVNGVLDIDGTVKYRRLVEYKNGYATGRVVMVFWNDGEFV